LYTLETNDLLSKK